MLVSFALHNHACFRDRAELSLEAVGPTSRDDRFTFDTGSRRYPRLNRATAIYGPNGSGKSRLVHGLAFAQQFVIGSAQKGQVGDSIPQLPFLFDEESRNEPTTFEVSFVQEGTTYELGFTVDRKCVREEWLFAWPPGGRMRKLVERKIETEPARETWVLGPSVHGPKETWRKSTRTNALFVSTAAQLNSDVFRPIVDWFRSLHVHTGELGPTFTIKMAERAKEDRRRIIRLLHDADIAVSGLSFKKRQIPLEELRQHVPPVVLEQVTAAGQSEFEELTAQFAHPVAGTSRKHFLDFDQESDGTQRFFAFAGPWLDVLDRNQTVVIDELDRSLHPHLVASLVRRINSGSTDGEEKRAQLVMTLHDVTLLQDVVDRTQVWFTEKDRTEAARLTPLSDFRPRRHESLMRGYLGGRYGGVPVVTEDTIQP